MHEEISDRGERIIPASEGEISFVYSRHKFAYENVQQFVEKKSVIDVGCGTGYGCKILAEKAELVYGIDYDAEAIAYSRVHYSAPNINYFRMDAASLELDRQFDIAVSFQVIEHLEDQAGFLHVLKRIVKPSGSIYISTPNIIGPSFGKHKNPFHINEMSYLQFRELIAENFSSFEILGIDYASSNKLRSFLSNTPIYRWGGLLKRSSGLKRIAGRALDLNSFKIINTNVENDAGDLLAVCHNV